MDPSGCGLGKLVVNLKVKPNKEWEEPERSASQALSESWEVVANKVRVSWQQSRSIRSWQSRKREETQKRPRLLFTSGSHLIDGPGLKMRDQSRHVSRHRSGCLGIGEDSAEQEYIFLGMQRGWRTAQKLGQEPTIADPFC